MKKSNENSNNADVYDDFSLSSTPAERRISRTVAAFNPFSAKKPRQLFQHCMNNERGLVELVKQNRN